MTQIIINTDDHISNQDALRAVSGFIEKNCKECSKEGWKSRLEIETDCGTAIVSEKDHPFNTFGHKNYSICSVIFNIKMDRVRNKEVGEE